MPEKFSVMTIEVTVADCPKRIVLVGEVGGFSFYGDEVVGRFEVGLTVFPPSDGDDMFARFEIDVATIDEFNDNSAAEDGVLASWKKGTETEILVTAPAIPTFPGQPKVEEVTFPVKLRIVTLPHKSRIKSKK